MWLRLKIDGILPQEKKKTTEHKTPVRLRGYPHSVKLAILIVLSALGGITSVLFGYAGNFLSLIPLGTPISGQLLSGFHVYWLVLSASILKRNGSATVTGALKGLIEMMLFSHLGVLVLFVSVVEGLVVDFAFFHAKRKGLGLACLAGGFSAASNIIVLQLFLMRDLPVFVYAVMYSVSFFSGVLLGGYLGFKTGKTLSGFFPSLQTVS
jgi:ABC-type thiamin/hydroxymethylpyrimidine transport system permease subunit